MRLRVGYKVGVLVVGMCPSYSKKSIICNQLSELLLIIIRSLVTFDVGGDSTLEKFMILCLRPYIHLRTL